MTKTEIKKDLTKWNSGRPFISITDLARVLHIGRDKARRMVAGLEYYEQGNRKDYLIEDIAERISRERKICR